MRIIVGLGNPGREYAATRHNIGFMVLNEVARRSGSEGAKKRFRSEIAEGRLHGEKVVLVAPQTYMNLSGHAVREVVNWYHVPHEDVLIVFDDMDLPFGRLRIRGDGSGGGHNGLNSIIELLGGSDIPRLRVGIGRSRSPATSHVLSRFNSEEERALPDLIARAADAIEIWMSDGITTAMNQVNQRPKKPRADVLVDSDGEQSK